MGDDAADQSTAVPTEDPRPDGPRRAPSLAVVNTGAGKGKRSAAFGVHEVKHAYQRGIRAVRGIDD